MAEDILSSEYQTYACYKIPSAPRFRRKNLLSGRKLNIIDKTVWIFI